MLENHLIPKSLSLIKKKSTKLQYIYNKTSQNTLKVVAQPELIRELTRKPTRGTIQNRYCGYVELSQILEGLQPQPFLPGCATAYNKYL